MNDDEAWMRIALQLARRGEGQVEPNPMVGCVIVKDGRQIGQGFHGQFGGPHAEVEALQSLVSVEDAAGSTAYVTLEPCSHFGKTPPCCDALIDAKVARVVVAMKDPFAEVDGRGLKKLQAAGIDVRVGVLEDQARFLNAPYLKRLTCGMPWTIAKWAMTIDGRIATRLGESQWITGPQARQEVHRLRSRVDAIIAGMGTVLADDPMLNARLADTDGPAKRIAKRVVICRHRLPSPQSQLIQTAREIPTWLFCSPIIERAELQPLLECGAVVERLETADEHAMVRATLSRLGEAEMTNVMIEGGATLLGNFLDPDSGECLLDECHVYVGGKLFGGVTAKGPVGGLGIAGMKDAAEFELQSLDAFGNDVRAVYRRRTTASNASGR
jgi:diaminohydroxyphosphoribosylaminopyrimidine deaminase/5-amino-6-(5-phosphoribosylamino)uracil reductase